MSPPQTESAPPELELPSLLERIHGNRQAMARLLVLLRDLLPGRIEALQQALAAGNLQEAGRAAHALRGSLSTFTTGPALQFAGDVERACLALDAAAANAGVNALMPRLLRIDGEVEAWLQRESS